MLVSHFGIGLFLSVYQYSQPLTGSHPFRNGINPLSPRTRVPHTRPRRTVNFHGLASKEWIFEAFGTDPDEMRRLTTETRPVPEESQGGEQQ